MLRGDEEQVSGIVEIDERLRDGSVNGAERTRLMFEQMLRGLGLNSII